MEKMSQTGGSQEGGHNQERQRDVAVEQVQASYDAQLESQPTDVFELGGREYTVETEADQKLATAQAELVAASEVLLEIREQFAEKEGVASQAELAEVYAMEKLAARLMALKDARVSVLREEIAMQRQYPEAVALAA